MFQVFLKALLSFIHWVEQAGRCIDEQHPLQGDRHSIDTSGLHEEVSQMEWFCQKSTSYHEKV